jgi:hypothetical protein
LEQNTAVTFDREGCEREIVSVFPTLAEAKVILGGAINSRSAVPPAVMSCAAAFVSSVLDEEPLKHPYVL